MDSLLTVSLPKSGTIRLDCVLHSFNRKEAVAVSLIYDTGADRTSITRDVLASLGYSKFKRSKAKKRSAIGEFWPDMCMVSKLVVGKQFVMTDMTVDVLEGSSLPNFDGVIGMDFISLVETMISGSRGTIEITKVV